MAVAIAAWMGWFWYGKVTIYEPSDSARLEVVHARFEVDTPVAGRVIAMPSLMLGAAIHQGELLVELDSETQRLELVETAAREATLGRQIAATRNEVETEKRALEYHRQQGAAEADAARSRLKEGQVGALLAADGLRRAQPMRASGGISEAEGYRLSAETDRHQAARDALAADLRKLLSEANTNENDRRSRIAALDSELARLEGELAMVRAKSMLLRYDTSQRQIRAPADGTISAIGELHAGALLKQGDRVATIVAPGNMRIVGEFTPAGAFGRVHCGQPARVHFEGFPWTEYGTVMATVSSVASEVRDAHARVELIVDDPRQSRVPLQHGLPARVSIQIERTTPARLILRAVGRALSSPPDSALQERARYPR